MSSMNSNSVVGMDSNGKGGINKSYYNVRSHDNISPSAINNPLEENDENHSDNSKIIRKFVANGCRSIE